MAKYKINHECGHTVTRELFGPNKERESKIEWLESRPCLDCLRAEEERKCEEQNKAAAEANRLAGYMPLTGTEKQIAWAETIRREAIEAFAEVFGKVPDEAKTTWAQTSEWLKNQTEAKWWIETAGTLKSKEGLAPLFGMIDGKQPKASKGEILRALLLLSPYLSEEIAKLLGIEQQFRDAVQARLQAEAKAEQERLMSERKAKAEEIRPDWFHGYWNCVIYSGLRIYLDSKERKLSGEDLAGLMAYYAKLWGKIIDPKNPEHRQMFLKHFSKK